MTNKREAKMQEKRARLLECALELFSEKGYINTPVRDIIAMSGYGTGTFYKYFKNKEDILKTLLEDLFEQIVSGVNDYYAQEKNLCRRFIETRRVILEVFVKNERLAEIYSRVAGINENIDQCLKEFEDKFLNFTGKNIEYGIENGTFRSLPVLPIAHAKLAIIKHAVYRWVVVKDINEDEMIDMVISFTQSLSIGLIDPGVWQSGVYASAFKKCLKADKK